MSDRHYYGYVNAAKNSFSTVDGVTTFNPINTSQGTVHPTNGPEADGETRYGDKKYAVEFTLTGNEHFLVLEDTNKSDGYGPRVEAGRYFEYEDAYRAAQGKGVQGGCGEVVLVTEVGVEQYTVIDGNGEAVVLSQSTTWRRSQISSRFHFLNADVGQRQVDAR